MIALLQVARRTGADVEVVPDDESGQLSVDALREMLDDRVRLVAISWIPTQGGLVNPAAAVGAVARDAGVPYLLDACQAAGQLPIDVDALGCDFLSATGASTSAAPRGTGFLYVRRRVDRPASSRRSSTCTPRGGRRGDADRDPRRRPPVRELGAQRRQPARARRGRRLRARARHRRHRGTGRPRSRASLRAQLAAIPGLTLHDLGVEQCGIVTFTVDGVDPYALAARLRDAGTSTSRCRPSTSRATTSKRAASTAVARASVHYYNTDDELARFVDAVAPRATRARGSRRHRERPARRPAARATTDDGRGDRGHAITTSGRAIARRQRRHRFADRVLVRVQRRPARGRSRSLAITHGCTRYGTTPGGHVADAEVPRALAASARAPRPGARAPSDAADERARLVGVEPAVGRDVVRRRAGRVVAASASAAARSSTCTTCTGGAAPRTRSGGRPSRMRAGQALRARADHGRGAQRGDGDVGVARRATRRAAARPRRPAPPARSAGWGAAATSSVSGTGLFGPRAVDGGARDAHDPLRADRRGGVEHVTGALDVDPRHQRRRRARVDDTGEVHDHVDALEQRLELGAGDVDPVRIRRVRGRRSGSRTSRPSDRDRRRDGRRVRGGVAARRDRRRR